MIHVLVLVVVSGLIAYLGDRLGTLIGKRRLSILGMRPRVTALVVAISTGILITFLTLGVAAMLSDTVKIALLSVGELKEERERLVVETQALQSEREKLIANVEELKTQVRIKEQEFVVFRKDEPISASVIVGSRPVNEVMKDMTGYIIELTHRARELGLMARDEITFFTENREQLALMAEFIASSTEDLVVAAIANENIHAGEQLGNVRFMVRPNNLIFSRGEEIAYIEVDGSMERAAIAQSLRSFVNEINHEVVSLGMVGNPLTGTFGDLSSESMLGFYDLVTRIKSIGKPLLVVAVVQEDTYAIGPLSFFFRIEGEFEDNAGESDEN